MSSKFFTDIESEFNSKFNEYLNDYHNNYITFSLADVYEQDLVIRKVYKVFEFVNMNKDIIKKSKYDKFKKTLIDKIDKLKTDKLKTDINSNKLNNCDYKYLFDLFKELEDFI